MPHRQQQECDHLSRLRKYLDYHKLEIIGSEKHKQVELTCPCGMQYAVLIKECNK